ncbi:MAG: acyl-CoA thioesterase [Gammaproteobacteria bacterium]
MNHRKLVQPEFMNEQGALFGGYLLKWVDEYAYMTVSLEHPGNRFVTIGLDQVEFKHPITLGEILRFTVSQTRKGSTSVSYLVEVFGEKEAPSDQTTLFATHITFVNLDDKGCKAPIK